MQSVPSCWKCHEPVRGPVCVGCGAVQPPRLDADYFAALGLQRRYFLDPKALVSAWRVMSRRVHPDRFSGRPAVERRMSLQWTVTVNEARRVLADPVLRARYLATGSAAPRDDGGPALDPEFLEEVFDLQMAAAADPDGTRAAATSRRDALQTELDALFTAWEAGDGDLSGVEERLVRLKYLTNAIASAD
jgi:molecular chaperone HscB